MKSRSIKYNIIINFFTSGVRALVLTLMIIILSFGFLHILSQELYRSFANAYNNSISFMTIFAFAIFLLFIGLMFLIFIKKMSKITDYIEEISQVLNQVSIGNMDVFIPVKRKDELGRLATNVNEMTYNLKELIRKEREWERQKNNLITNLSHDLRTPLTSILGFLELIEKGNYDENKLKHYCKISLDKAKELKESVDQLFEFAKINNADLNLNKSEISIEELIEQLTIGFIPSFEDSNMEYRITSNSRGLRINADPILLVRAFENIISNSIKYSSEGKYLDIIIDKKEDNAIVKFVNYGEQINQTDLLNLFNKFYRAEKSFDKREGTGLGLAIVKTIIELHSGKINVKSSKEKTEFEFILPINIS